MKLNTIYLTFNGEVNPFGIGSPAIFVRLQGCHIRCYKTTLGILCDTPEALKKPTEKDKVAAIVEKIVKVGKDSGVMEITLTGGDPLWNDEKDIVDLLTSLTEEGFKICVETSGTIDWLPYTNISKNIFWILDYKLKSCGVKSENLFHSTHHLYDLSYDDFIKFVVYDKEDLDEAIIAVKRISDSTNANLAVGAYWGGKISTFQIFERFKKEGLLSRVVMNFQVHKLVVAPNYSVTIPERI